MNYHEKYKVGDYIVAKTMSTYRIIDVYDDGITQLYDIKSTFPHKLTEDSEATVEHYKCLTEKDLKTFGNLVSEEDYTELASVLYDK